METFNIEWAEQDTIDFFKDKVKMRVHAHLKFLQGNRALIHSQAPNKIFSHMKFIFDIFTSEVIVITLAYLLVSS